MSLPTPLTIEAGLQAEQDLLASVCAGDSEFGLLFWNPAIAPWSCRAASIVFPVSTVPAKSLPPLAGRCSCAKLAASPSRNRPPQSISHSSMRHRAAKAI